MSYSPNNPNGSATSANSAPVVIANDQAAVPVSAASLPLPTGAATETTLAAINTKLPAQGQAVMAASQPVVIASNQSKVPVTLQDAAGAAIGAIDADGANQAIMVAQSATSFFFSTTNSTSAQLAASAVFTGTIESAVNQQSFSILAISDQPGTLTIEQYIDLAGTQLAQTLSYSLAANQGLARSGVINGNYFRITYQNTGASTTTTLKIDTAYGTIPASTQLNNAPVSLNEVNGTTISMGQQSSGSSLPVVISSSQTSTIPAVRGSSGIMVTPIPQKLFRTTFAKVRSSADTEFFTTIVTGTGQGVTQAAGNLLVTTGTTTNAETILRSTSTFSGSTLARIQTILSQRIVNNNFFVELVDVIGDSLVASASSATSLTVTIPSNPFTSENVGQSMYVGALAGGLVGVPNRYAIASVSGNNVTFTVAGFSVTSGTCSLFGWNYIQATYNTATATSAQYDTQRKGWNNGNTSLVVNTTAAPGHQLIMGTEDGNAFVADQLVASGASVALAQRGSRVVNLPDETATLYLQIRAVNGSTAPASTTTWTLGMCSVENYTPTAVSMYNAKAQSLSNQSPVTVTNTPAVTVSSGTVTTVSTVTTLSSMTSGNLAIPGIIADVASAALITTTTTATLTPTFGIAYSVVIPVTVVSGTLPTLDVQVQESDDTGTNWVAVYDFPRITTTGIYRSPQLALTGNRVRYVQTVSGTTPSFTRAINRLQSSRSPDAMFRQQIDRSIVLTTLNSTTPILTMSGAGRVQLSINIGTTTIAPILQLQGSDDGGLSWYSVGTTLTAVASSTVEITVSNVNSQLLRALVQTAGTATVAGYVMMKVF